MGGMKWSRLALASLALFLVFALYVVGYFAVIERRGGSAYATGGYQPAARFGGDAAVWLYYPVIELDRRLRPSHWQSDLRII